MTRANLTLRDADAAALDRIEDLLAANDLPHDRLRDHPVQFVAGYEDGDVVAAGGLERHGAAALLRSVVVAEPYRSRGHATAVCDELEAVAADDGVDSLYLLTTTAKPFFERRGFRVTSRDSVPQRLCETPQFTGQCPASATCMRKSLDARE